MYWKDVKKQFMDNNLIEELFESNRGMYTIGLYAGLQLIAICNDPVLLGLKYEDEQVFIPISEKDALMLLKHSADGSDKKLFQYALDKASNIFTFQESFLENALNTKAEVESGERKRMVSEECIRELKKGNITQRQEMLEKYGTPPKFSDAKFGECLVGCFFTSIGAPYWLVGRPLPALLCMAITILMLTTFNPIFIFLMSISMIVNFFIVVTGKLKDKKGLYVLPKEQKENIMRCYNQMERYMEELR